MELFAAVFFFFANIIKLCIGGGTGGGAVGAVILVGRDWQLYL